MKSQRAIDKGKYLDALVSLRTALQKDPQNPEYRVLMAELYTEMGEYDESNLLIFELLREDEDFEGDCVFGLGCNFMGLQDYEKAQECFEKYLDHYPEGAYEYEAQDMLDLIDEHYSEITLLLPEDAEEAVYDGLNESKQLIDNNQNAEAVELLKKLWTEYPKLPLVGNHLALALFWNNQHDEALALTEGILSAHPENVHACCNLLLFEKALGNDERLPQLMEKLQSLSPADPEDQTKLAFAFCEAGDPLRAYNLFKKILLDHPYDARFLYLTGASAANAGRLAEALDCFLVMLKLDPKDSIALYYRDLLQRAQQKGQERVTISYFGNLPPKETQERMEYLNQCLALPRQELVALWQEEGRFSSLMHWGLGLPDPLVKRAFLEVIGGFADAQAASMLRRYLLNRNESDALKHEVFLLLKHMGEKEPYVAYLAGKIAEVRVGTIGPQQGVRITEGHTRVVERMLALALSEEERAAVSIALQILKTYLGSFSKSPVMRNTSAWAGAFLLCALPDPEARISDFSQRLGVKPDSLRRCLAKIRSQVADFSPM